MEAEFEEADRPTSNLRGAWIWAGAKISIGLLVLAAVIGIRIIQATPADPAASAEPSVQSEALGLQEESDAGEEGGSIFGRLSDRAKDSLPGATGAEDEGARLVSCRLADGVRFMTSADCAVRGGQAKIFTSKKQK